MGCCQRRQGGIRQLGSPSTDLPPLSQQQPKGGIGPPAGRPGLPAPFPLPAGGLRVPAIAGSSCSPPPSLAGCPLPHHLGVVPRGSRWGHPIASSGVAHRTVSDRLPGSETPALPTPYPVWGLSLFERCWLASGNRLTCPLQKCLPFTTQTTPKMQDGLAEGLGCAGAAPAARARGPAAAQGALAPRLADVGKRNTA